MSIPEDYKADHLIMLVGTNPLPNYVTAKTFGKPGTNYYFVYSTGVADVKDNLLSVLELTPGNNCTLIEVKEADSFNIFDTLQRAAGGLAGKGRVVLNYTGGTKMMSVHAYRGIEKALPAQVLFTYLDARSLLMVVEKPGTAQEHYPVDVTPGIKTLLNMHGFDFTVATRDNRRVTLEPTSAPVRPDEAAIIVKAYASAWNSGAETGLKNFINDWNNWKQNNKSNALKSDPGLQAKVILPTTLSAVWAGHSNLYQLNQDWKMEPEALWAWLSSGWLEQYVLQCAKKLEQECGLHDVYNDVHAQTIKIRADIQSDMQLDVTAMKGHQFFLLSCMASAKKRELKEHFIEAYVRGRQFGGDEARIALVCLIPETYDVQGKSYNGPILTEEELSNMGVDRGAMRVFGLEHLENLEVHLKEWFNRR